MSVIAGKRNGLSLARRGVGFAAITAIFADVGIFAFVQLTAEGYEDWLRAAIWFVPISGAVVGLALAYAIIMFCDTESRRDETE